MAPNTPAFFVFVHAMGFNGDFKWRFFVCKSNKRHPRQTGLRSACVLLPRRAEMAPATSLAAVTQQAIRVDGLTIHRRWLAGR